MINKMFVAVEERFGAKGVDVLSQVVAEDHEEMAKFLMDILDISERDAVTAAAVFLTIDANCGNRVSMTEAASDRSSASFLCSWCGFALAGATNPEVCKKYGAAMGVGIGRAIDPNIEKLSGEGGPGPPCHATIRRKA
jgi:rubrerythrin